MNTFLEKSKELFSDIVKHRRHIHSNPELSFQEKETSKYIQSVLDEFNIKHQTVANTGVVAHIGKGDNCVALRADIDALPIKEETGLEYASKNDGVMHACGHDMHAAMLLGAAELLKSEEEKLKGTVKLIFQPAEEKLPGGAKAMIEGGALKNPKPKAIFGQHIFPHQTTGTVAISPGAVTASSDELYWRVTGKSGHAAQPQLSDDAILASSQLVVYLQSLTSKYKDPVEPGVLSVTSIRGGEYPNIFPEEVKLMGTLRSFNNDWRMKIHSEIERRSIIACSLYNSICSLDIKKGHPATINEKTSTESAINSAKDLLGENSVLDFKPAMWAEDFSYYAREVPGVFWFLGVRPPNEEFMPALHNSKLAPDEDAMIYGTALLAEAASNFLKE